ncbi:hypothetical protein [Halobaculum roseum]|uniref:DUF8060 domain-containing protein n=1 Tax=Halobaculum roseum TaxID=2175149 RepID=A0ABD5MGL6_9EURY|nr:hypothetical protein [Halobaculum roseum]
MTDDTDNTERTDDSDHTDRTEHTDDAIPTADGSSDTEPAPTEREAPPAGSGATASVDGGAATESVDRGEPTETADRGAGVGDSVTRYVNYLVLVALVVLALVAGIQFYGAVSRTINQWVVAEYRSLFHGAFNLAVLLVAAAGISVQIRRVTS